MFRHRSAVIPICLAVFLTSSAGVRAQNQTDTEEDPALFIMSSLIGEVQLPAEAAPQAIFAAYYALLPPQTRAEIDSQLEDLNRRTEDYLVAFRAGDTAELNEIVDELVLYWASIRSIHLQSYTPEVVAVLESAYAQVYPFIQSQK